MLGRACYNPASYCFSYNCLKLLNDGAVIIFASSLFHAVIYDPLSGLTSRNICGLKSLSG